MMIYQTTRDTYPSLSHDRQSEMDASGDAPYCEYLLVDTASAAVTVDLNALGLPRGWRLTVIDLGNATSNNITITASAQISGAPSVAISADYGTVSLYCDGVTWHTI